MTRYLGLTQYLSTKELAAWMKEVMRRWDEDAKLDAASKQAEKDANTATPRT
jgi:hypothetical protein